MSAVHMFFSGLSILLCYKKGLGVHKWHWKARVVTMASRVATEVVVMTTSAVTSDEKIGIMHDDVIKLKHFPRYWPFVSPVNSPHKGQWRGPLMFSLICARTNDWVNNREAGDLRCHRAHYDVTAMITLVFQWDIQRIPSDIHMAPLCFVLLW